MNDSAHISQEDLAFFAMQTLRGEELVEVRKHLHSCEDCRKELSEVVNALIALGTSVEQHVVSGTARQRFLTSIASETQDEVRITNQPKRSSVMTWIPWAVAATLAIVSILLTMKVTVLRQQLQRQSVDLSRITEENVHSQRVVELLTDRSARRITLVASKTAPEPSGQAIYVADRGELIFQGRNLKPLLAGKTYELWLIPSDGRAPIPAGLFQPDSTGFASVVMPALPIGVAAKAFGVTIENAEGSSTPTAPIILSGT